jgi:membrane dipeptidase
MTDITALAPSPRAAQVLAESLVWDNHGCMPLVAKADFLPQLSRYRKSGVNMVSINVTYDVYPWYHGLKMLAYFRSWLSSHADQYVLVRSVSDVIDAKRTQKLAVAFDIEGACAIDDQISLIDLYYDLGVRWMLVAYNRNNRAGGGCKDQDSGLTEFGRQVVAEMARVGMVVCCSHTGERTAMQVIEHSPHPVILSHSNPLSMWRHRRNVSDSLMQAVAATGGVVGLNGLGHFLGDSSPDTFIRHLDYAVALIGPEHVGLGLDYVFDVTEMSDMVAKNPEMFPPNEGYGGKLEMLAPESIPVVVDGLLKLGYSNENLRAILGGNFLRVAQKVWK